jgi:hypothetical protein
MCDRLVVTSPLTPAQSNPVTIKRSDGFTLHWKPFSRGDVLFAISGVDANGVDAIIECMFPGSDGQGTVDGALLQQLTTTHGASFGGFALNLTTGSSGTFTTFIFGAMAPTTPAGDSYSLVLQLQ